MRALNRALADALAAIPRSASSARTSAWRAASSPPGCYSASGPTGSWTPRCPSRRSPASRPGRRFPGGGRSSSSRSRAAVSGLRTDREPGTQVPADDGRPGRGPVTCLVPGSGSRVGWAGQHSDHPYSLFAHAGVKTLVPATPTDAYGLLVGRSATRTRWCCSAGRRAGAARTSLGSWPRCRSARPGAPAGTDVTVVAVGIWSTTRWRWRTTRRRGLGRGLRPPDAYPFDWAALAASLERTGRLVVVETPTGAAASAPRSWRPPPRRCA